MRIICRVCLLLAPLSLASMIPPTPLAAQYDPHRETSRPNQIPFQVAADNMLLVEGRIGRRNALRFVVDTGTPTTLVDQEIVRSLGLESQPKPLLHFGRTLPAGFVILPDISFGPVKALGVNVGVADLSFTGAFGAHVDAIIGLDLLRRRSFTIDLDAKILRFGVAPPAKRTLPIKSVRSYLTIEAELEGRPLRLVLDTGFNSILLFSSRIGPHILPVAKGEMVWPSADGAVIRARAFKLTNLRLGESQLRGTGFLLADLPEGIPPGVDGFLGTGNLKARRLNFDLESNTFGWEQ